MVLKPHICGVKKEIGGPNRPHDAPDAGSWGAAGRLKCPINANKTPVKCNCGLQHGQPAQRTMSKVILDGLLGFLTPPGPNQAKMGSQLCS